MKEASTNCVFLHLYDKNDNNNIHDNDDDYDDDKIPFAPGWQALNSPLDQSKRATSLTFCKSSLSTLCPLTFFHTIWIQIFNTLVFYHSYYQFLSEILLYIKDTLNLLRFLYMQQLPTIRFFPYSILYLDGGLLEKQLQFKLLKYSYRLNILMECQCKKLTQDKSAIILTRKWLFLSK